jgi:DNA-binding transcriptional LysR family regulator
MDKNDLDGLLTLKLVAEHRSFASAAEVLGISPSAVSQIVKQLEHRLRVPLLTRTTRSVNLTDEGSQFLQHAGPAIEQVLAALENVGTLSKKPSGLLRLNLPRFVFTSLTPLLSGFLRAHPDISVELFLEDSQTDVVEKGFDAGIRVSDILAKDMVAIKLRGPIRFVTVASPAYLKRAGIPKHPRDLLQHNCLRGKVGDWTYEKWEFEQKGNQFQVHVKGSLIFNDSFAMLHAAKEGLGVAYIEEEAAREEIDEGELEVILDSFAATSTGYYLYYPKVSQVQPKLRAFINYVKDWNSGKKK